MKAFLYSNGSYTELLPPGWIRSYSQGLNNNGDVAGWGIDGNDERKGFLYSSGSYTELMPPGLSSFNGTIDVNDSGVILGNGWDMNGAGKGFIAAPIPEPTTFLVIDEDSIDNGNPPNFFWDVDVNADIAEIGLRTQLPFFTANVGQMITLHTGEVGDEGWFALKTIPESWDAAGPTDDGLRNFVGNPSQPLPHNVGPGLGAGDDPEALLDKIPDVTPLRATGLKLLEGRQVCAVVYNNDISINHDPLNGSLKGDNLGTVAFEVLLVTELTGFSSSSLPKVEILILDAEEVCEGELTLFTEAPEPISSSEPYDVMP